MLGDAFERARSGGRRADYLLCNPHNPTGVVHTAAELQHLVALAEQHGVRVIADENPAPLVLPGGTFVPYLSVAGDSDGFALLSASKGWNLAGLKAAVLVAGVGAAGDLQRTPEVVSHGPSHVGAPSNSDTASSRNPGNPSRAVPALPSPFTWGLLHRVRDTAILRPQARLQAQAELRAERLLHAS